MAELAAEGRFDEVTQAPWYADGLNDGDLALLTTLASIGQEFPTLYEDLVRSYYVKSKTISLPLAGEVRLWALDPSPFPEGEDTLRMMEEVVRASEAFMGVQFPVTDVIMVVPSFPRHGMGGYHAGSHLVSARIDSDRLSRSLVYHEVAHYYFGGGLGPIWLTEGGAELMRAITRDELGVESLDERRRNVQREMEWNCHADDLRNIQQLNKLQDRLTTGRSHLCNYIMGEHFLLTMVETLGEQVSSAALREIYQMSRSKWREGTEGEVYRAFLRHTPPELEAEIRALYKRLHGGTYDEEEGN